MKIKYAIIPSMLGLSLMLSPKESITANNGKVINLQSEINKDVNTNTFSKTEKIVTDDSKTSDKNGEVHDIDLSILDERAN